MSCFELPIEVFCPLSVLRVQTVYFRCLGDGRGAVTDAIWNACDNYHNDPACNNCRDRSIHELLLLHPECQNVC